MKNFKYIILIILASIPTILSAQIMQIDNWSDLPILQQISQSNKIKLGQTYIDLSNLSNSPYLHEEFSPGQIIDKEKKRKIKAYIRYRIIDDVFEVKKSIDDDELHVLQRSEKYDVLLNTDEMFTFQYNLPVLIHGSNSGYVEVLVNNDDKVSLYKRLGQTYNPGQEARSSYQKGKAPSISTETYYMIKIGNRAYSIEPHKRKAADAFPDKNEILEDYIKDNKLKFRGDDEEKALIQLVEYYNSLN
ncbi:hypothetical protein [Mesonia maritima]|uniref:Uncharacterized protein n=1 Tax=Mesonia maritima TaxID=1793873 RepID=A0ABU1K3L4_9FLAO|nr:hypothetical protein [Mesonia maritima]MDR6300191.1 hypothetical protein [Mesonia maritima]